MKPFVYVVEIMGEFELITTNKNTAVTYWWQQRTQIHGLRPNIAIWTLGKWNAVRYMSDQEITDYYHLMMKNYNHNHTTEVKHYELD